MANQQSESEIKPQVKSKLDAEHAQLQVPAPRRKAECLVIALVVTFASLAVPYWLHALSARRVVEVFEFENDRSGFLAVWNNYYDLLMLGFGLVLIAPSPKRYGLRIGTIRQHWRKVLLVCGLPIVVALVGAAVVPLPAWMGERIGVWLISPLAQDMVFVGFLYTILSETFPGNVHPRIAISRGLLITAALFALWHVPNLTSTPPGFVCLQVTYTFLAFIVIGLSRQWTGSFLYATATHMTANFIGWWFAAGTNAATIGS